MPRNQNLSGRRDKSEAASGYRLQPPHQSAGQVRERDGAKRWFRCPVVPAVHRQQDGRGPARSRNRATEAFKGRTANKGGGAQPAVHTLQNDPWQLHEQIRESRASTKCRAHQAAACRSNTTRTSGQSMAQNHQAHPRVTALT